MKKPSFLLMLVMLISVSAFAEFQLEPGFGYFFNTDDYDGVKRSFNGMDLNITLRYLFTENVGLFFGGDFKSWFSADNGEYVEQFQSAGMKATLDDDVGCKLDLVFGLALACPVNDKFGIQGDLGLSATVWGIESITGTVKYMGYTVNTGIFIDKISSMGVYANVFGKYLIMQNGYITFGLRMDYKFNREESGEVITSGVSQKYSGKEDNFSGFSIAPFIGYMGSY